MWGRSASVISFVNPWLFISFCSIIYGVDRGESELLLLNLGQVNIKRDSKAKTCRTLWPRLSCQRGYLC